MSDAAERAEVVAGATLIADEALLRAELDVARATVRLGCARSELVAEGVVATNLLGPWDGAAGVVEWARVVAVEAGETCVELRVRFATVPRHYRLVAKRVALRRVSASPPRTSA